MATEKQSGPNSAALEARIAVLEELFVRLAQAGATEGILDHGFNKVSRRLSTVSKRLSDIATQMEPLRALGPEEPKLEPHQIALLQNLVNALVPPDPKAKPIPSAEQGAVSFQMRSAQ